MPSPQVDACSCGRSPCCRARRAPPRSRRRREEIMTELVSRSPVQASDRACFVQRQIGSSQSPCPVTTIGLADEGAEARLRRGTGSRPGPSYGRRPGRCGGGRGRCPGCRRSARSRAARASRPARGREAGSARSAWGRPTGCSAGDQRVGAGREAGEVDGDVGHALLRAAEPDAAEVAVRQRHEDGGVVLHAGRGDEGLGAAGVAGRGGEGLGPVDQPRGVGHGVLSWRTGQ